MPRDDEIEIKLAALTGTRLFRLVDEIGIQCGLTKREAIDAIGGALDTLRDLERKGQL